MTTQLFLSDVLDIEVPDWEERRHKDKTLGDWKSTSKMITITCADGNVVVIYLTKKEAKLG